MFFAVFVKFGFCPEEFPGNNQIEVYVVLRTLFVLSRFVRTYLHRTGRGGSKARARSASKDQARDRLPCMGSSSRPANLSRRVGLGLGLGLGSGLGIGLGIGVGVGVELGLGLGV